MLRRLTAEEALDWGLVNEVVPPGELRDAVRRWADNMLGFSPTSLKILKQSFNTDTEHMVAMGQLAFSSLTMFSDSPEAREGITAFNEKRTPDFSPFRGG